MPEQLGSGLQNRVDGCNSRPDLGRWQAGKTAIHGCNSRRGLQVFIPLLSLRGVRGVKNFQYIYNNPQTKTNRRELRRNQTEAEKRLWQVLRSKQLERLKFFRQYNVGQYILDFYSPKLKLAIELDGGQRAEEINKTYDDQRSDFLRERTIKVLRFWNNEVMETIEGVADRIGMEIKITPPHLPLV